MDHLKFRNKLKCILVTKNIEKCANFDDKFFKVCFTFSFYQLAMFSQNVMVRDAISFKLWKSCQFYDFMVVSISCKIRLFLVDIVIRSKCYLQHFAATIKKYLS